MLLSTTEALKAALSSVHRNLTFTTILSSVDLAEQKYLEPALGRPFLDELAVATSPSAATSELLSKLRASLANYAVLEAAPMLGPSFSDMGLTEQGAGSAQPVRQWVYYNFIDAAATAGDGALERALTYLDEHLDAFPTYAASDARLEAKELFIQSGRELARYLNLPEPRRAYLALRPFLRRVEELTLRPMVGDAAFDALKAAELANNLTPEQKGLRALICPALAHRAMAEAVPELAIAITGGGVRVLADHDGVRSRQVATDNQLDALARRAADTALRYETRLQAYLDTTTPLEGARVASLPENAAGTGYFLV